jgi:multicomponent Na+:H+ antiporter subunit B
MNGMSVIVKTVARIMVGFVFLYGIFIILHGHLTPGGGFGGGCIIAGAFILIYLAYGKDGAKERLQSTLTSIFESIGGLLFWLIALLGIVWGYFFFNFLRKGEPLSILSGGVIPLANIAIGIKVSAALFAVFIALASTKFMAEE